MSRHRPDEVKPIEGGEGLSKNEQKRRAKQAEKERLAAEKAAAKKEAAAAAPEKKKKDDGPALEDDDEVPPEKYFENRLAWCNKAKSAGTNPYPHKFQTTTQLPAYQEKYSGIEPGGFADAVESVAGA